VHEAKNATDLARLFAACRSGHVAVLVGSTEKMGVGTNVQDRAIALHHLDAPWRPADVDQREGRIIRQGNLNAEVQIIRYLAARSFDGYMWQTLERKARFIHHVMSPSLDSREIGDIGDTVLSFAEAKALATDNPLLMDKAEADATLARLVRAERAHRRNQDTLRRGIGRLEQHIVGRTRLAADIDLAIARRQDTQGGAFTMTVDGQRYRKRADAGHHLLSILRQEAASQLGSRQRTLRVGELGGFTLTATISLALGQARVTTALDGAPDAELTLTARDLDEADPAGLVTRLENRLSRLEASKDNALAEISSARSEIEHAAASLGKPFPWAADLIATRERSRQINEQLEAAVTPPPQDAGRESSHEDDPDGGARRERDAGPGGVAGDPREPAQRMATPQRPSPPWPSAAERQAGPTPAGHCGQDADQDSSGIRRREPALPQYRDGSRPHGHRDALADPACEEREAGQ